MPQLQSASVNGGRFCILYCYLFISALCCSLQINIYIRNLNVATMKETRDHILKESLKLFMKKSYKEVTMREIVNATGLSKGAFYHYFVSKEAVFEEVARYFYTDVMITDYSDFPESSLKDFCNTYIQRLHKPSDAMDDADNQSNLFVFLSEATRKIPSFLDIHNSQRKKEVDAWSAAVSRARKNGEIHSVLSDEDIAKMFIYLSDGIALSSIVKKPNEETLLELTGSWNNLHQLLVKK